jgi:hypothetical protein
MSCQLGIEDLRNLYTSESNNIIFIVDQSIDYISVLKD